MFTVLNKEIRSFFSHPTGYIILGIFLTINGLFLWVIPGEYNVLENGYANIDGLFSLAPWLFLFLCPAITMNLITAERLTGTWELLITKPLSVKSIIFGKFFAVWIVVVLTILPSLIYFFSVLLIAEPIGNVDTGAFVGSFFGLILLSGIYLSIGIFASSISANQILSFLIALVISFLLFYGFELFAMLFTAGEKAWNFMNFGINSHYKSISRGVIDLDDIVYFFIGTSFFLSAAWFFARRK
jgi:ABC-2 type transport system permease protein